MLLGCRLGSFPIVCASHKNEDALVRYDVHPNPSLERRHEINGDDVDGDDGARVDQLLLAGTD